MYEYRVIDLGSMYAWTGGKRDASPGTLAVEERLNEAAREGFRFVAVLSDPLAHRPGGSQLVLMEREAPEGK